MNIEIDQKFVKQNQFKSMSFDFQKFNKLGIHIEPQCKNNPWKDKPLAKFLNKSKVSCFCYNLIDGELLMINMNKICPIA